MAHLSLGHVRHERFRSQSIGRVVTSAQPKEIATRTGELLSAKTHRKIKCLALQALSTSTSSITNRKSRFINVTHRTDENARSGTISSRHDTHIQPCMTRPQVTNKYENLNQCVNLKRQLLVTEASRFCSIIRSMTSG